MNISFIGLGKLGLPVAVAIDAKGHNVLGYDINPKYNSNTRPIDCLDTQEKNADLSGPITPMLENSKLKFADSLEESIKFGDIVFVAIQTPHIAKYGGQCPIPDERVDFDYTWLINCIKQISEVLDKIEENKIVTIISTVLPGTVKELLIPHACNYTSLCYNPFFIAMGTTIQDFLDPEFVLLGSENSSS